MNAHAATPGVHSKPALPAHSHRTHHKLGITQRSNGEVTYTNSQYSVTIRKDGAIQVKHGDWLSKYSAAMYNNFEHIHEFGRMEGGKLVPIRNPNLIITGETIYHIPTYIEATGTDPVPNPGTPVVPPIPDPVKKVMIRDLLKRDYDLKGEHLDIVGKAADYMAFAETGATVAEIVGITAAGAVGTALSIVNNILAPIVGIIAGVNAAETGERMAGMRAIAYAITAWTFDDPPPKFPAGWHNNIMTGGNRKDAPREERAWIRARDSAWKQMDATVAGTGRHKGSYQAVYRALGDNDRQKLAETLMRELEKRLKGTWSDKQSFWSPKPNYPLQ